MSHKIVLLAFFQFLSIRTVIVVIAVTIAAKVLQQKKAVGATTTTKKFTQIVSVPFASTFYGLKRTWKIQWWRWKKEEEKIVSDFYYVDKRNGIVHEENVLSESHFHFTITDLNNFENAKTSSDSSVWKLCSLWVESLLPEHFRIHTHTHPNIHERKKRPQLCNIHFRNGVHF